MIDCTKFVEMLGGKPVAVFGLGVSGLSTVKALCAAGAKVLAWDDREDARAVAQNAGAEITPLDEQTLKNCAALTLAPGVPLTHPQPHPVVEAARAADIEIFGDLEILHRCAHGRKTIGITGTNGKSTTTALLSHILNEAGYDVAMGGNIGRPVLDLELPGEDGFFVFEISSYQLDLCPSFRPDIGVLLNITPDHLDRHGNFKNYAAAKERIFEGRGTAVVSLDDEPCRQIYERLLARKGEGDTRKVIPISCEGAVDGGIYVEHGTLFDARAGAAGEKAGMLDGLPALRGSHNHQNAASVFAALRDAAPDLQPEKIFQHMRSFPGLAHRQFQVRTINGVPYINDSKATNIEAAGKALAAYRNIYWIAGGRPKGDSLDDIREFIPHLRHVFLIGEAMVAFAGWLDQYSVPYTLCGELKDAVGEAHKMAQEERGRPGGAGTVLLSPACASFDQFRSFEERGDIFAALVEGLQDGDDATGEAAA